MVNWDDQAAYDFLDEWSNHSEKHELYCAAASKRLKFKDVSIEEIKMQKCKIYPERVKMYVRRYVRGKPIGTLFCRYRKSKAGESYLWLKDGNHRFRALRLTSETHVRIAYDPEGVV